jgi:hypothetical protein
MVAMKNHSDELSGKTDAQLIAIADDLAVQLDRVGDEQDRRNTETCQRENDFQAGRDQSDGAKAVATMDRQSVARNSSD